MFVRFVIDDRDLSSGRRQGLFQAAAELDDRGAFAGELGQRYAALVRWFDDHLGEPSRLSLSSRPNAKAQAISWFKAGRHEHLGRMHELRRLIEAAGVQVRVLRTARPGYVVYEDEVQVAACPFADTPS